MGLIASRFWSDARHYQIAALSTLTIYNLGWIDFGARPLNSALALTGALVTQIICSRLTGIAIDLRSPLITGLSLSLLLRTDEPLIHLAAGILAIGSKFVLRLDGKHIWNPAGFAIVVLLFATPSHVWISPGAWGSQVWLAALLCFFAISCSVPRAAPTSRSSSSARTPPCCSVVRCGSATHWLFRSISCRADRCSSSPSS